LESRQAEQHATRGAFLIPGVAAAIWAPLVPFAKTRAGMDDAMLGVVLLCLGAGSLIAMPLTGVLAARQGCRRVMVATAVMMCAMLPLLAVASSPTTLGLVLFVFGAGLGAMDCAMNIQAVVVERESGRAMMSGFHAFFSIGGFAGAALMTALLSGGLGPFGATGLSTLAIVLIAAFSIRYWRAERAAPGGAMLGWPHGAVILIGSFAFLLFLAEGAVLDWSAVFLTDVRRLPPSEAGSGFVAFALTMTITRLLGDRLVQRVGRFRIIVLGAICAAAGFLLATWVPHWPTTLLGFALVGLGCANIVPALFSMAGQQKVMPEGLAVAAITTLGYAGILVGPALIGFMAHATSLVIAFTAVAAAVLGVAIAARWLKH
jgi:predicted MFS family arabinose efflux permease